MSFASGYALGGLNRLTELVSIMLLAALVIVASMQVFFRYILLEPLVWSEEAARYLLIWLTFATAGLVLRENGNPRIEAIAAVLPPRWEALVNIATQLLTAAFLLVFIWASWKLGIRYMAFTSVATGVSQAVPRLALPVGGALMFVNLVPSIWADIVNVRRAEGEPR